MSKYSLILVLCAPSAARGQTLDAFLASAEARAFDNREAAALVEQRDGEAMQTWGKLLPALSASASYTRNQQAVELALPDGPTSTRTVTLNARDQLDANLTASVPLIDVQTWVRTAALVSSADAQRHRLFATRLETERQVARAFYSVVAARALLSSAETSFAAQEAALSLAVERKEAGLAGELDVRRAKAEVERARQTLGEARYSLSSAKRTLETLSGLDADPVLVDEVTDAPANEVEPPSVLASRREKVAAERSAAAAWTALVPTLTLQANERFTNSPGFLPNPFWSVTFTARFSLDAATFGAVRAQRAAAEQARVRTERAERNVRDQLADARDLFESNRAQAQAARSRLEEAALAVSLAKDRRAEGKATQLDVILAERDLLSADVARIRAVADLRYARALVTLCEGHSLRSHP